MYKKLCAVLVILAFIAATSHARSRNICCLPREVGPCKAAIPRYYFNHETGRCEFFIYGGCQGNANRFETIEECQRRCSRRRRH